MNKVFIFSALRGSRNGCPTGIHRNRGFDSEMPVRHLAAVHRRRELESLEFHRRIVPRLEVDAVPVMEKARGNLRRWLAGRGDEPLAAGCRERDDLLAGLTPQELCRLLVAEDERTVRLQQSSRFATGC